MGHIVGRAAVLLAALLVVPAWGTSFKLKLVTPRWVPLNGDAVMRCDYSVQESHLHKVEWQRNTAKIFTYVRNRKYQFTNHTTPGAVLDMGASNQREILLRNMDLNATGYYTCEVSTETPIYTKASDDILVTVYDGKQKAPKVTSIDKTYIVGQILAANCTTTEGRPLPYITWLWDGVPVDERMATSWGRTSVIAGSSLHVKLNEEGDFDVSCVASLPAYESHDTQYAVKEASTFRVTVLPADSQDISNSIDMKENTSPIKDLKASTANGSTSLTDAPFAVVSVIFLSLLIALYSREPSLVTAPLPVSSFCSFVQER